jgi:hypothetical protein
LTHADTRRGSWRVACSKWDLGGGRLAQAQQGQAQVVLDGGVVRGKPCGVLQVGQGVLIAPAGEEGRAEHLPARGGGRMAARTVAGGPFECFKLVGENSV